jgi:hypothetical protein
MFAVLAAICFIWQFIFEPDFDHSLVVLGLAFLSLHLAFSDGGFDKWRRWPRH